MHIYPFHAFEKRLLEAEKTSIHKQVYISREQLAYAVLKNAADTFGCEYRIVNNIISQPLDEMAVRNYAKIYGLEAVYLSLLLHPISCKVELNERDMFASWKMLNRVWHMLNSIQSDDSTMDDLIIKQLHVQCEIAVQRGKVHTLIARIMHFVKIANSGHSVNNSCAYACNKNSFCKLLSIIEILFPALVGGFLSKNES